MATATLPRERARRAPRRPHPVARRAFTPEEFLALPDSDAYELDDCGHLVERQMGQESDEIAFEIARLLGNHVRANRLGRVSGGGTSLRIFPERPQRIPRADVVFVRRDRQERAAPGHLEIAPDLVAEVVSPNDLAEPLQAKIEEYLAAGVRLVWVVFTGLRTVTVYRVDGSATLLHATDTITGEDVILDFSSPVASFFPE